eukprot:TRINITY_DN9027_c0_g1_i1.p1 TRINITY_DN9027_c0_g1~~TRINITY_DN9027_c0_g1_i1.p1  ORF type:complete len:265 (+),score=27.46 TRINITY_DN9027_c0_g1_i1:42-836(+)
MWSGSTRFSRRVANPNMNRAMHSPRLGNNPIRRAFVSSSKSLQTVVLQPKTKHHGTVIFLHGLGDTGYGWAPVMELIQPQSPHIKFIMPTAPSRPVTINGGMRMPAWYDIKDLSDRASEDYEGLEETKERVLEIIEEEVRSGIPPSRIVLGGFSQGGACALYIGYSCKRKLGGVMGLSCYLPYYKNFAKMISKENEDTQLLMCHGIEDNIVMHHWGEMSFEVLRNSGIKGVFKSYQYMGHEAGNEEIEECSNFIKKQLPPLSKL